MAKTFNRKFAKHIARVWILLVGAYFLWEAANYRGIYGWLAEAQIEYFGGYVPLLNYAFLVFLGWVPIWIIRRLSKTEDKAEVKAELSQYDLFSQAITDANRMRLFLIGAALAACGGLVMTLVFALYLVPSDQGSAQSFAASELETATIRLGPTRLVGGELGPVVTFGQDWLFDERVTVYAPYQLAGPEQKPRVIFIRLSAGSDDELKQLRDRPAWTGVLVEEGVPGTVQSFYQSLGVAIATPYYTLYPDINSVRATYWVQAGQLALLSLLLLLVGWWQTRRVNRLREDRDFINPAAEIVA